MSRHIFRRAIVATSAVASALAAPIDVVNPGFEDITGASVFNEFTFGPLPGWTVYGGMSGAGPDHYVGTLTPQIIPEHDPVNYQNFPAGAYEGQRVGIAFNFAAAPEGVEYGLEQELSATLQPHTAYSLSVAIGNIATGWSLSGQEFFLSGFPGYRIDLMAGGMIIASDNNSLAGTIPDGEWGLSTVEFTTGASHTQFDQALAIRLVNLNLIDPDFEFDDREVDFDAVSLSAIAVPEPATATLLVALGAGLCAVSRARRRIRYSL